MPPAQLSLAQGLCKVEEAKGRSLMALATSGPGWWSLTATSLPLMSHPQRSGGVRSVTLRAARGFAVLAPVFTVEAARGWILVWHFQNRPSLLALGTASRLMSFPCVSCAQLILFGSTDTVKKKKQKTPKPNRKTRQRRETITEVATCLNKKHLQTQLC